MQPPFKVYTQRYISNTVCSACQAELEKSVTKNQGMRSERASVENHFLLNVTNVQISVAICILKFTYFQRPGRSHGARAAAISANNRLYCSPHFSHNSHSSTIVTNLT